MLAIEEGDDNDEAEEEGGGNDKKEDDMWANDREREREQERSVWENESTAIIGVTTFHTPLISVSRALSLHNHNPWHALRIMIILILDLLVMAKEQAMSTACI